MSTRALAIAPLTAAVACVLAGCGGGGEDSSADDIYRPEPARLCFENAGYSASVAVNTPNRDVHRLRVLPEGGGTVYVTIIFTPGPVEAERYAESGGEIRGNAVLRGPGTNDDAVTQCMLEAKQSG